MTLDQDVIANIVYLAVFGGVIGGAMFFIFLAVLEGAGELLLRSLERHRDRAGLARA